MSDINFNELMKKVSQMDQKELQSRMDEVAKMLNSKNPNEILNQLNNNLNTKK